MITVNYGQLDAILRSYGFVIHEPRKGVRVYTLPDSEALFAVPIFPDSQQVSNMHLLGAKATLDAFGIANADEFTARLLKAG